MRVGDRVVLDACILIPMPLADTLLSLAEFPGLYEPRWSDRILEEVGRNLRAKLGLTERQVIRRESALREFFPEAAVTGYESLIEGMANHPKDRHVLAAAIHCGARTLVTSNLKDFPSEVLGPMGVECLGPSEFLRILYNLEPETVAYRIEKQAALIDCSLEQLLIRLRASAPGFVRYFCAAEEIDLG